MQNRYNVFRFSLVFVSLIFCLLIFSLKLVLIQVFHSSHLARLAEKQHNHLIEIEPIRGTIFDRKLRPLAMNITVYSLFANPKSMSESDKREVMQFAAPLINVTPAFIEEQLSKKKSFVWLKRKLPAEVVEKINKLKINGLDFMDESKRYYPGGELAAHVIGFAGIDNEGLEGIEMQYNKFLKGEPGLTKLLRDARQRDLLIEKSFIAPRDGLQLVLTIDETIQYIAERALEKAYSNNHAQAATIIVMDVKTGEILALANRPTYNLQNFSSGPPEARLNRAISLVYEPGSIFKIVAASAMFEENAFQETDKIFCENGSYKVANHILHDHGSHGTLTVREVFEQSSNIGVTKIAQRLGPDAIYKYARKFRFGLKTNIDLNGEIAGTLKLPSQWSKTSIGAIPIGQEVTTSPIQLVSAISALANNGVYMRPFIVKYIIDNHDQVIKSFEPQVVDQVVSPETVQRVRELLVGAVENGTGQKAKIKGMRVAGKTGTAQKVIAGTYSHDHFMASFIGFAPADHPRLAAIVVFDDPHPSYFGGTVSAPVFREVMENSLRYLDSAQSPGSLLTFKK